MSEIKPGIKSNEQNLYTLLKYYSTRQCSLFDEMRHVLLIYVREIGLSLIIFTYYEVPDLIINSFNTEANIKFYIEKRDTTFSNSLTKVEPLGRLKCSSRQRNRQEFTNSIKYYFKMKYRSFKKEQNDPEWTCINNKYYQLRYVPVRIIVSVDKTVITHELLKDLPVIKFSERMVYNSFKMSMSISCIETYKIQIYIFKCGKFSGPFYIDYNALISQTRDDFYLFLFNECKLIL